MSVKHPMSERIEAEDVDLSAETSPIGALCKALRERHIEYAVLFKHTDAETIFARGDVINVARAARHGSHKEVTVVGLLQSPFGLCYYTTAGGPFSHTSCTLVRKADASSELASEPENEPITKKEMAAVRAIIKREFKDYLDKSKELNAFLNDQATMGPVFARDSDDYVHGSREYELGEELLDALGDHYDNAFATDTEEFEIDLKDMHMEMTLDQFAVWVITELRAFERRRIAAELAYDEVQEALDAAEQPAQHTTSKVDETHAAAYDNSHNRGFRGRLNQRSIDGVSGHDESSI